MRIMLVFMLGEIPPNNILIINFISTVVATISEVFGMCDPLTKKLNRRVAKKGIPAFKWETN